MTTVQILRLAAGGDGVGKLEDGRTVFVPRTAPGDLVELSTPRNHARFARARLARVLAPGSDRVVPRCGHYIRDDCGGCQWQHLDPGAQREAKRVIVADALRRIARLDPPVAPVEAGHADWGYRTRITLAVGPGRRYAGFHPLEQASRVFPLDHCDLAAPPLMTIWAALRRRLTLLPPDVEQLVLRLDRDQRLHVVVRTAGEQVWARAGELAGRIAETGVSATIWWQPAGGAARVLAGAPDAFPATVFEQVNPQLGDRIRDFAIERLGDLRGVHVWDLYSGTGDTTDRLVALGATVESVELDRRAVEVADRRWRAAAGAAPDSERPVPAAIVRHTGRVEELVSTLARPGAVIANPPRAGLDGRVVQALLDRRPARLVYVSCDPATLARDLGRLCRSIAGPPAAATAGPAAEPFRLTLVQPFDLFPQTAHVETVALLEA